MSASSKQKIAWVATQILPHEPALRAWLKRVLSEQELDDVVQEAYCRIAALQQTDHILNSRRYFFQTARNVMLEQVRRTRVVRFETVSWLAEVEHALPFDELSPERIVGGRQLLRNVEAALARMPERSRSILVLRKVEGLSQREIASLLGLSETIVENEVSRGVRRILKELSTVEQAEVEAMRTNPAMQAPRRRRDR